MSNAASDLLNILRHAIRSELSRDEADLTLRQFGVYLVVYQGPEPQTVRGLAKALFIDVPVVLWSIRRLGNADLVRCIPNPTDGRSILVMRTERGEAMMRRLGRAMAAASLSR